MTANPLTQQCISALMEGPQISSGTASFVQILAVKAIHLGGEAKSGAPPNRFRVTISDGEHSVDAMLGTGCVELVNQGLATQFSVARINECFTNDVRGRRILIITSMEITDSKLDAQIGNPVTFDPPKSPSRNQQQHPQSPQPSSSQLQPPSSHPPFPSSQKPHPHSPQPSSSQPQSSSQLQPPSSYPPSPSSQKPPHPHSPQPPLPQKPPHPHSPQAPSPQKPPQQQPPPKKPPQQLFSSPQHPKNDYNTENISLNPLTRLKDLAPYRQRWTIKGRCTYKSAVKTYNSAAGHGTVARLHLCDEDGVEIEATLWRDAVNKYFDFFEIGKVYYVSKATVKLANKRFANVKNDHTITIETWSIVQPAPEDDAIKAIQFKFVNIADVKNLPAETLLDVYGIVIEIGDCCPLVTKSGKDTARRIVKLADKSGASIEFAFWGEHATNPEFDQALHSVLAVKNARVSDYNEKSLSTGFMSFLQFSPDQEECRELKGWYDKSGGETTFSEISQTRGDLYVGEGPCDLTTIAQMQSEAATKTTEPSYFFVKLTIILFRKESSVYYPSCSRCSRKVLAQGPDAWRCEACDVTHDSPEFRYILSFNASDHTGSQWFNCFDDVARVLLGGTDANKLFELKNKGEEREYDAIFDAGLFRSVKCRVRAKLESYQDDKRMKYTVSRVYPLEYVKDTAKMIEDIKKIG